MNPFDYIQNWSIFRTLKNKHALFTKRIKEISHFSLNFFPLNYSELCFNEFEFNDDKLIRISYYIEIPKLQYSLEFENYLLNVEKSYLYDDTLPNIDKIYNDFLKFKGIGQNSNNDIKASINWNTDLSQEENNKVFKCRVDDTNKVNVIYQNSFHFSKYFYDIIPKMLQCAKLFFENEYPAIIIESQNGGGMPFLYAILLQILQPRIEMKDYRSFRVTSTSENYLKNKSQFKGRYTQSNCQELKNYDDITKFYFDDYGDNSIQHKRTDPIDVLPKIYRLALKEFMNEFKNNKNIKNPTDIIIFTDSFSFSAGSGFIKGFQNTGGAVTVGYYGNPKIQGTEMYDASQSSSQVEHFDNTNLKNELIKIGFDRIGVTIAESYNFHQNDIKNQIPREYDIDTVDFRVNIYSDYSDEKYQEFIDEGLKIHKLLNVNNECNPKNTKLLLHSEECKNIHSYEHSHGGYQCDDKGQWNKLNCQPYYCDDGYYFDQIQKLCLQNCNFEGEKAYFIYENNFDKTFKIEKDKKYYFIFTWYQKRHYASGNKYISNEHIKMIEGNRINDYDYEIKEINALNKILLHLFKKFTSYSFIKKLNSLIFFEDSDEDYVLYIENAYKNPNTNIKIAKINESITMDDILNINTGYFSDLKENKTIFKR